MNAGEKLKKLREEAGLSVRETADLLGVSHTTYASKEDNLKKEFLPMEWARRIAPVFAQHKIEPWRVYELAGVTSDLFDAVAMISDLPEGRTMPGTGITREVVGIVAAGVWGPAEQWEEGDDRRRQQTVPLDYPHLADKIFLLRASGQSMNQSFVDGSVLTCVPLAAWEYEIPTGATVIAERRLADGTHEATVKRLEIRKDRSYWLWPHSDHPDHQEPIKLPPPHRWPASIEDAGEEAFVSAIVVNAVKPL